MSSLLNGLRGLFSFSRPNATDSAADETPLDPNLAPPNIVSVERLRSHPEYLEVWTRSPCDARHHFSIAHSGGQSVAEMPRGISSLMVNLGGSVAEDVKVQWHASGGTSYFTTVTSGSPLKPTLTCGIRIRVHWEQQQFPLIRISAIRWITDESIPRPVHLDAVAVPAGSGQWEIPQDWLALTPVELRLTPLNDGCQGPTEQLIVPPRLPRIEVVFERVLLAINGRSWRRLKLVVRTPASMSPPSMVHVDWIPHDKGVTPASTHQQWPETTSSLCIPFDHISMRGDRLLVRLETTAGYEPNVAWFSINEYSNTSDSVGVLLTEGKGSEYQGIDYVHEHATPIGVIANILSNDMPLSYVPGLEQPTGDPQGREWPSTLVSAGKSLAKEPVAWAEISRIRGLEWSGLNDFATYPQQYIIYAHEPALRAIALRCPAARCESTIGHLIRCWQAEGPISESEVDMLQARWESANDDELDRWVAAVAAGASVSRINRLWCEALWLTVDLQRIIEVSCYLDHVKAEPLQALVPHVLPDGFVGGKLQCAVKEESRLPSVSPPDLTSIWMMRETVLAALAAHWTNQTQIHADERYSRIAELLGRCPATAATELAALSRSNSLPRIAPGSWPVFVVEQEFLVKDAQDRSLRRLKISMAADWCRILLEHRLIPAWPWFGTFPDDWNSGRLLKLWNSVLAQLKPDSRELLSSDSVILQTLDEIDQIVRDTDDDLFKDVIAALRQNSAALYHWIMYACSR